MAIEAIGPRLGLVLIATCISACGTSAPDSGSLPDGGTGSAFPGDTFVPWEGGPSYYAKWSHGPSSDPNFFPIGVWLQTPGSSADAYKAIGINTFVGLWDGPLDATVSPLEAAGLTTFCDQSGDWASFKEGSTIRSWTQTDEPDNAQPDGQGGWGSCILPPTIVARYNEMKANDSTRPVYLNFGRTVADEDWPGRGDVCFGHPEHYPQYIAGADIVSYDIYPANQGVPLWYVAQGVDRLREYADNKKPVWNWIETTRYDQSNGTPTPAQVKTEVWMSLIHGSRGIGYFVHIFTPSFIEAGLLSNAAMKNAVAAINQQITALAPVLNTQSVANGVTTTSTNGVVPVDTMLKRYGGATYLFAVAMRDGTTTATFNLRDLSSASVEVLGENRNVEILGGSFQDTFSSYAVHLYKLTY